MKYLYGIVLALALIMLVAFLGAGTYAQGLVPCGTSAGLSCNLCDLYTLVKNIIDFLLFNLALPIAVIVFLIGGILLLASQGSEERLKQGKAALTNAVFGIIIAFAAWLIVNTLLVTLGFQVPFSQALPWNKFPTCEAPIASSFIPPTPKERCDLKNGPFSRSCTVPSGNAGRQVCEDSGFWSACLEFCADADLGKTRTCTIGGCNGSQTCSGGPSSGFWTECKDDTTDSCIPGAGGICTPTQQGHCAVNNLASICFGNLAAEASQICIAESHGDPLIPCKSEVDKTPSGEPVCFGLFQIHLQHQIGTFNCREAIEPSVDARHPWRIKKTPEARTLYNNCVAAAKDPEINIRTACNIRNARGTWRDWFNSARDCRLL